MDLPLSHTHSDWDGHGIFGIEKGKFILQNEEATIIWKLNLHMLCDTIVCELMHVQFPFILHKKMFMFILLYGHTLSYSMEEGKMIYEAHKIMR